MVSCVRGLQFTVRLQYVPPSPPPPPPRHSTAHHTITAPSRRYYHPITAPSLLHQCPSPQHHHCIATPRSLRCSLHHCSITAPSLHHHYCTARSLLYEGGRLAWGGGGGLKAGTGWTCRQWTPQMARKRPKAAQFLEARPTLDAHPCGMYKRWPSCGAIRGTAAGCSSENAGLLPGSVARRARGSRGRGASGALRLLLGAHRPMTSGVGLRHSVGHCGALTVPGQSWSAAGSSPSTHGTAVKGVARQGQGCIGRGGGTPCVTFRQVAGGGWVPPPPPEPAYAQPLSP